MLILMGLLSAPHDSSGGAVSRWWNLYRPSVRVRSSGDDDHVEVARPVDALDAVEFDVRGGRRAGDERDRATVARGGRERGDRVRNGRDDVLGEDDADVVIGHERERAAARCGRG